MDRCILVGAISLPLLAGYWIIDAYLLEHRTLAPFYDWESLRAFQICTGGFIGLWLAQLAIGFSIRRRYPESRAMVHATIQLYSVGHAIGTFWVGPVTSPHAFILLGGAAIALVLFDRQAVLYGMLSTFVTFVAGVVAASTGAIHYAPLLAEGPWVDGVISGFWLWQMTVVIVAVGGAVLVLFAHLVTRLRDREARLVVLSTTDALTGVANRRHFLELFEREFDRATRHQTPLGCVVIDLDHFKSVNDRYGHIAGDRVLVAAAKVFKESIRAHDLLARWGGEEFVVLLPQTDLEGAEAVAERCRSALEDATIDVGTGAQVNVTASVGIAIYPDPDAINGEELLRRADAALYEAKRGGRNRLASRRPAELTPPAA